MFISCNSSSVFAMWLEGTVAYLARGNGTQDGGGHRFVRKTFGPDLKGQFFVHVLLSLLLKGGQKGVHKKWPLRTGPRRKVAIDTLQNRCRCFSRENPEVTSGCHTLLAENCRRKGEETHCPPCALTARRKVLWSLLWLPVSYGCSGSGLAYRCTCGGQASPDWAAHLLTCISSDKYLKFRKSEGLVVCNSILPNFASWCMILSLICLLVNWFMGQLKGVGADT